MTQIQDFKENAYQSVWDHGKAMFKHLALPVILMGLAFSILGGIFIYGLLGDSFMELAEILAASGGVLAGEDPQEIIMAWFQEQPNAVALILGLFVFALLILLVFSWFINLCLTMSKNVLLNGTTTFSESFSASFNKTVWVILAITVILQIAQNLIERVFGIIIGDSVGLGFLLQIVLAFVFLRFVAATPAASHGSMGIGDSLSYSWRNITWRRAGLILLIFIGVGIAAALGFFAMSLILGSLGAAGGILIIVGMYFLGTFAMGLYTAFLSGVFFRYADVEIQEGDSEPESHLVEE